MKKIFPTFFYTTKSFLCAVVVDVVVVETVVFGCSHHIDYNDFVHYNIDYNRVDYNGNYSPFLQINYYNNNQIIRVVTTGNCIL